MASHITHVRKNNVIRTLPVVRSSDGSLTPESSETFKSINAAKRASRALQKKPGVVLRLLSAANPSRSQETP